jgi:hypothetical protein
VNSNTRLRGAYHPVHTTLKRAARYNAATAVEFAETVPASAGTDDSYSWDAGVFLGRSFLLETIMTPAITLPGRAKMLRIYVGEADRWEGKPLYEQIVLKVREHHGAGATVHKGSMGYGASQRVHAKSRLGLSRDLPVMITIVDTEEHIRELLPVLDAMVTEGLVVLSDVDVIKYVHRPAEQ